MDVIGIILEATKVEKIEPLVRVGAVWERESSEYPDVIKVPMKDGHVIEYRIDQQLPHPSLMKAVDIIRIMNDSTVGGYKFKERRRRRSDGRKI